MKPIIGRWYELTDGGVAKCTDLDVPLWGTRDRIRRDLTIGPDTPITAGDVGGWAICRDGTLAIITESCKPNTLDVAALALHYFEDDKRVTGHAANGTFNGTYERGHQIDLTRWLTARECRERGLDATHPSQMSAERKPGEFRVGDRVQVDPQYAWALEDGKPSDAPRLIKSLSPLGDFVLDGIRGSWSGKGFTLIEPAREGDRGSLPMSGAGCSDALRPASSPPAPSDPVDYFRSVMWPEAPPAFPLGQRAEPEVRREVCPCRGRIRAPLDPETEGCPECLHPSNRAGRGWQEVK